MAAKAPAGRKPLPSSFRLLGVTEYEAPTKKTIILALDGDPNTGKSEIGLQAPDPSIFISLDRGLEGVIGKHMKKRAIGLFEYELPTIPTQENSAAIWNEIYKNYYESLANPDVLSIVIDKGGDLWDVMRMAVLGAYEKVPPLMYKQTNSMIRQMFRAAKKAQKNLIVIHEIEKEYETRLKDGKEVSVPNGDWKRDGFKGVGFLVDAEVLCQRKRGTQDFKLIPMTCKRNMSIVGDEIEIGPNNGFSELMEAIYQTPYEPEEWGM